MEMRCAASFTEVRRCITKTLNPKRKSMRPPTFRLANNYPTRGQSSVALSPAEARPDEEDQPTLGRLILKCRLSLKGVMGISIMT